MYEDNTVGVVVPAYNEERFVGEVIDTIPGYVDRIYVVDDCSVDDTWSVIQARAAPANDSSAGSVELETESGSEPASSVADGGTVERVVPLRHETNRGVGGAIKTGYLQAHEDGIDVTAVMGGDGQMDPDALNEILTPVVEDHAEYAKGNRLRYRADRETMTRWRFLGNAILSFLTKVASGYWKTMDPQNGYTVISHRALSAIDVDRMYEGYGYCNDLLVKLNAADMRVADVTLPAVYGEEESHISYPSYIWSVSGMLLRNFLWRLKVKYLVFDFHPLALFYVFGAASTVLGTFGISYAAWTFFTTAGVAFIYGTLSLIVLLIGFMLCLFAMLFDMQMGEDLEVQHES